MSGSSPSIPPSIADRRTADAPRGEPAGSGRVEHTRPMVFSADETTDIGYESGTTVSPDDTAHGSRFVEV